MDSGFDIKALYGAATAHSTAREKRLLAEQAQRQLDAIFNEWCGDWASALHRRLAPELRIAAGIEDSVILAKLAIEQRASTLRGVWHASWDRQDALLGMRRIAMEREHLLPGT